MGVEARAEERMMRLADLSHGDEEERMTVVDAASAASSQTLDQEYHLRRKQGSLSNVSTESIEQTETGRLHAMSQGTLTGDEREQEQDMRLDRRHD